MKTKLIKFLAVSLLICTGVINAYSQRQITEFFKGNVADAELLSKAYLEPYGKMFGSSLNGGWYQAARPHKLFGFNVTFVTTIATVPSTARSFDVSSLGLENLQPKDPENTMAPTIAGKLGESGVDLAHKDFPNVSLFSTPKGAGMIFTPMTLMQAGVGLPYHNEVTIRYMPTANIPRIGRISLWGAGIKNEFKEFIPFLKRVPIDLSVMVGYTNFSSEFDVSLEPKTDSNLILEQGYEKSQFKDQKLILNAHGFTGRLLVGKTLPIISLYAGLGYSYAITNFGLIGKYPIGIEPNYVDVVDDPFLLNYTHPNFSANAGFRVRMGVIALNFDYTLGEYALYSLGIGISFR